MKARYRIKESKVNEKIIYNPEYNRKFLFFFDDWEEIGIYIYYDTIKQAESAIRKHKNTIKNKKYKKYIYIK